MPPVDPGMANPQELAGRGAEEAIVPVVVAEIV